MEFLTINGERLNITKEIFDLLTSVTDRQSYLQVIDKLNSMKEISCLRKPITDGGGEEFYFWTYVIIELEELGEDDMFFICYCCEIQPDGRISYCPKEIGTLREQDTRTLVELDVIDDYHWPLRETYSIGVVEEYGEDDEDDEDDDWD